MPFAINTKICTKIFKRLPQVAAGVFFVAESVSLHILPIEKRQVIYLWHTAAGSYWQG